MSTQTPSLRNKITNPRTGKTHHRRTASHQAPGTPVNKPALTQNNIRDSPQISTKPKASQKMPTMETQTDNNFPLRDEEMHKKLDALAERFTCVETDSTQFKTSLEFTQNEVDVLKEENIALKDMVSELSLEIKRNTYAIEKLGTKHENLQISTRKRNLIFEGVPETQGGRENLHDTICKLFAELGVAKPIDYDLAYRIGQNQGKYPRPIFISFIRLDDRNLIYSSRTHLRNSRHLSRVWISEDVTPQT